MSPAAGRVGSPGDPPRDPLVIALFSEIVITEQLARTRLSRALPKGWSCRTSWC